MNAVFNLNTPRFDLIHEADESERGEIVRSLWASIRDRSDWDVVEMRLVKSDSWIADVVALAEAAGFPTGIWRMDSAPFISLPRSDDPEQATADFLMGPRKHLRQQLERRTRRLNEIGTVEYVVSQTYSPELLKKYFALEASGWKGRQGTAAADDPKVASLHHDFAKAVSDRNAFLAYELKLDGKTIAMSLTIKGGQKMSHWKTSYDEAYARYSPGNLLFRKLVTDCIAAGLSEIDLLSPSTANKRFWAAGEREHVAFYIFRRGFFGSLLWAWKFLIIHGLRAVRSQRAMVPAHAQK